MNPARRPGDARLESGRAERPDVEVPAALPEGRRLEEKLGQAAGVLLDTLRGQFDYIVVDLPRALVEWMAPVVARASRLALVTDTSVPCIRQAKRLIEFLHEDKFSRVTQREIGTDSHKFANALRSVLRQDPDFILVGELRDLETIEAALVLAETGHLTFGTLHTSDAVQTVNRIIDVFPAHQQQQVRTQLSFTLEAVFCQQLLPNASGRGRALAAEVMLATPAIRALIREGKGHQMYSQIQTGGRMGMKTMSSWLADLVRAGKVRVEDAEESVSDPNELRMLIRAA